MKPHTIVFFGSPDFAVPSLEALHKSREYSIKFVVTQPDRPAGRKMKLQPTAVKKKAQELGYEVYSPASVNTPEFLKLCQESGAEVGVVVAFGQILGQALLEAFPQGMVNVHGSLLPRWRGAAPIQRALMAGDGETGVSLQKVVRKLDAGDVLAEKKVSLSLSINAEELYKSLSDLGSQVLTESLGSYLEGGLTPRPQDEAFVTLAPKISKDESLIQWSRSALEIHNQIRGLAMGPHPWTYCGAKKLKIRRATPKSEVAVSGAPGEVLSLGEESFLVQCGQGALEVLEVQPESKSKMSSGEFLRGYGVEPGDCLGQETTNRST